MLGVMVHYLSHRQWLKVIQSPSSRSILARYPRFAFKYTSPYLSRNIPRERRLQMLQGHYAFINQTMRRGFFEQVLDDRMPLWEFSTDERTMHIDMTGPCLSTLHREGEITLNFRMDGQTLCRLACSVVPVHTLPRPDASQSHWGASHVLYVGQVQGVPHLFDAMKLATRLCHDISPVDMLLHALTGLGQVWDIDEVLGVCNSQHISASKFMSSQHPFDYDRLWQRYGGSQDSEGHFHMDLPFPEKPLNFIANHHRGRNRRKRQFKQTMAGEVASRLGQHLA